MKRLCFDYYMQIDYSEMVSRCNYTIKCIPKDNLRQKLEQYKISLFPETKYSLGVDGLKNIQLYGLNGEPHKKFSFHITGTVQTGLAEYDEAEDETQTMIFSHPHGLNIAGEKIKAYYEKIKKEINFSDNKYEIAKVIMRRLHEDFNYKICCTDCNTSAEEAFSIGSGVCQDYAHIFISLLHLAGIPARYVTGMLVGEGASHAWVEILHQGLWYGLDPTNNVAVLDEHIKLGIGRDAKDCQINRGIMHGGGLHIQTINVSVKKEIED